MRCELLVVVFYGNVFSIYNFNARHISHTCCTNILYLQSFYGKDKETATEEFFCNFEVNPEFEWAAMEAGFPVVARGAQGEIRAIESPVHRFFLATLFQPQLSSTDKKPHPVVVAFVQAAADWGKKKLDDSVLE